MLIFYLILRPFQRVKQQTRAHLVIVPLWKSVWSYMELKRYSFKTDRLSLSLSLSDYTDDERYSSTIYNSLVDIHLRHYSLYAILHDFFFIYLLDDKAVSCVLEKFKIHSETLEIAPLLLCPIKGSSESGGTKNLRRVARAMNFSQYREHSSEYVYTRRIKISKHKILKFNWNKTSRANDAEWRRMHAASADDSMA